MTSKRREAEVTITDVGGRGDGIARLDGAAVYVPFTVAGDRVRVALTVRRDGGFDGRVLARLGDGADRSAPACVHFTTCGGCALQHFADDAYAEWKLGILRIALARQGLPEMALEPLVRARPGERRRARFAAVGRAGGVVLGFNAPSSHSVVDLRGCPVVTPRLAALLPPLRRLLSTTLQPGKRLDVEALDLDGTLDVGIVAPFAPALAFLEAVAQFGESCGIARVTWRRADGDEPEPMLQRGPVRARFGGIAVDLPPGAFLQASASGEAALADFVQRSVSGRIVELFAGSGTFTLPLAAAGHNVTAFEGDATMVRALSAAARGAGRVVVERRDLVRRPLQPAELAGTDCVLLDPPRAGAAEQVAGIVQSSVPRVVYVSCNPVSFARDARRLAEAGFGLRRVLPVDQFLWSPHLELAALLQR